MEFIQDIENKQITHLFYDYENFRKEYELFITQFVGNDKIKLEIISIFKTIIFEFTINNEKPSMGLCNIVITAGPGMGKTSLAVHISKLMYYFGFKNYFKNAVIKDDDITIEHINKIKRNIYISSMTEKINNINKQVEIAPQNAHVRLIKSEMQQLKEEIDEFKKMETNVIHLQKDKDKIVKKTNDPIYRIFTPADFIAGYVGQTTIKTREILEKNRNKVIIIDEAYGFATSKDNWFGKEALIEINNYMSEYPDEYMFIFCGYKDLIEKNIMELQPGIKRRIRYHFNIEKYTTEELVTMFRQKAKCYGTLPNNENLISLFKSVQLSNYGGDIDIIVLKLRAIIAEKCWSRVIVKPVNIELTWIEQSISDYKIKPEQYNCMYL